MDVMEIIKMCEGLETERFISACIELTDSCKVGCPYCLLENYEEETSENEILNIVDILNKYGIKRFSLGGGEPLDVPYIYNIGSYIKKLGGIALLRTSACSEIDFEKIDQSFNLIDVSIDSCKLGTLKICKPHIDGNVLLNNVLKLSKSNVPLRCNILITIYNLDDVMDTVHWLYDNGVYSIRIQRLVPRGKARNCYSKMAVSDNAFNDIVAKCMYEGDRLGISVTELKSVNSQTLCIVKPNGLLYIGHPNGLIGIGHISDENNLNIVSEIVGENQIKMYSNEIKALKSISE